MNRFRKLIAVILLLSICCYGCTRQTEETTNGATELTLANRERILGEELLFSLLDVREELILSLLDAREELSLSLPDAREELMERRKDIEYDHTLYESVIEELSAKAFSSNWPEDAGVFYDLDENGTDELIVLHHSQVDYYDMGEKIPYTVCSVYTIVDGEVMSVLENEALFSDAGGPSGHIYIGKRNGQLRLAVTGETGGGGGDEWYGDGHWKEYYLEGKNCICETNVTYRVHETSDDYGNWLPVYADCDAELNGTEYSYAQYEDWTNEFEIILAMGSGQRNDGVALEQLLSAESGAQLD